MSYLIKISSLFLVLLYIITINAFQKTQNPLIMLDTPFGEITAELYPEKAPTTVANFLSYIKQNRYDDCHFYRVVHLENQPENKIRIEVIQGGLGFDKHPLELKPIEHETTDKSGITHKNGTISMARLEPGTASSEFFICINDQPELDYGGNRNPDGQGFAAFGQVLEGLDILEKIQNLDSKNQILDKIVPIQIKLRD